MSLFAALPETLHRPDNLQQVEYHSLHASLKAEVVGDC